MSAKKGTKAKNRVDKGTYKTKLEEDLFKSVEKYKDMVEASPDSIIVLDKWGTILTCNSATEELTGLTKKQMIGKRFTTLAKFSPKQIKELTSRMTLLVAGKKIDKFDIVATIRDGRKVICAIRAKPLKDGTFQIVVRDITDRKKAEEKLRQSEEMLSLFMDSATEGFSLMDSNLNYVRVNREWLKSRGISDRKEVIGKNIIEVIPGIEDTPRYAEYKKVLKTRKPFIDNNILIKIGGREAFYDINAFKVGDGLGVLTIDTTESKKAEDELRNAYNTVHNILEKAPFGIYVVNKEGTVEYVNPKMVEISTYSLEEFMNLNILARPNLKRLGITDKIMDVFNGESFFEGPVTYTSHDKKKKTIRNFVGIPLKEYGEQKALIFVEDITEMKRVEKELERSYQTMRHILDKAPFGIYLADSKGNMEYVNPKMLEISGDSRDEFMKFNVFKMPSYKQPGIDELLRDVFKGKSFFKGPVDYVSKPSEKTTIRNFMGIPLVEQGEKKALVFIEDITKRKKAERELAKAYEDLKSLDVIKDDFINTTSHALKTPLTSITSFTDLLHGEKLGPLNDRQKDGLEVIKSEARRLNILINHILDSSKIEAGQFVLHASKINFTGLVADSVTSCSRPAWAKGNEIKLNSPGIIHVNADPFWIEKVVDNLISNSVKFTDKGKIEVTVKKKDHTVKFVIKDNGRGMDKKHLKHIFDKFYQAEQQTATGTGLGLYISKELVDAHGGKIGCVSKGRGKGATFWFTLPA